MAEIGLVLTAPQGRATGRVLLDRMAWDGAPDMTLTRPTDGGDFWWRAWVNTAHFFSKHFKQDFRISQDSGEGMILQGARDWRDYVVEADLMLHLGDHGGLILRATGQRRYYAVRLTRAGQLQIVRRNDDSETVLASADCALPLETAFTLRVQVQGPDLTAKLGDIALTVRDDSPDAHGGGAMGLSVYEGALSATRIRVSPVQGG